jgi:hypothetical protein
VAASPEHRKAQGEGTGVNKNLLKYMLSKVKTSSHLEGVPETHKEVRSKGLGGVEV